MQFHEGLCSSLSVFINSSEVEEENLWCLNEKLFICKMHASFYTIFVLSFIVKRISYVVFKVKLSTKINGKVSFVLFEYKIKDFYRSFVLVLIIPPEKVRGNRRQAMILKVLLFKA